MLYFYLLSFKKEILHFFNIFLNFIIYGKYVFIVNNNNN